MSDDDRPLPRVSPDGAEGQGLADVPTAVDDAAPAPQVPSPAGAVSLMITKRQKEQLRVLGFSDGSIRDMTPAEAHAHLGL